MELADLLWVLTTASYSEQIEDRIADFYLAHNNVKNLVAKIENGDITLDEESPAAPATNETETKK